MTVRLKFVPRDFWIGVFWRKTFFTKMDGGIAKMGHCYEVFICLLPMLPIIVTWTRHAATSEHNTAAETLPRSIHTAELTIGGCRLRCHVLDNGMRVFDAGDVEAFFQALGGDAPLEPKEVENLARFVTRGELPTIPES